MAPLRRSGGVRGGVVTVAWAVMLVRVGVSALRLWAEWQGQDDTLWLASTNRHRTHWHHDNIGNQHTLFVATGHFSTADQLERHTGAPHTPIPTALNCLLSRCLLRAFLLVLLRHCILVEFFCTLQYATQNLHMHSNVFDCITTILRRKHTCVFLIP